MLPRSVYITVETTMFVLPTEQEGRTGTNILLPPYTTMLGGRSFPEAAKKLPRSIQNRSARVGTLDYDNLGDVSHERKFTSACLPACRKKKNAIGI